MPTLSAKLVPEFGEGFSPRNLARMIALAEVFPDEQIEVFELVARGIRVAEYMTELPPKQVLEARLHNAVRVAQARLEARGAK